MHFSRRGMLIAALAGGGLALGYVVRPRTFPLPLSPAPGEIAFDAWIKIAPDGVISVAVPQLEMGQGVTTLIAQVVATELGADWRQVAIEPSPVSAHYANLPLAARWSRLWMPAMSSLADEADDVLVRRWAEDNSFMVTADGTSLAAYETPAREAAASVRAMLAQAAASRWDVAWEACDAREGFITHGGNRASFAELATEAAGFEPPYPPPLRPVAIGGKPGAARPLPRLAMPSKADGSFQFTGDVRLPGMVFAAIHHGPVGKTALGHNVPELADIRRFAAEVIRNSLSRREELADFRRQLLRLQRLADGDFALQLEIDEDGFAAGHRRVINHYGWLEQVRAGHRGHHAERAVGQQHDGPRRVDAQAADE